MTPRKTIEDLQIEIYEKEKEVRFLRKQIDVLTKKNDVLFDVVNKIAGAEDLDPDKAQVALRDSIRKVEEIGAGANYDDEDGMDDWPRPDSYVAKHGLA